MVGGLLLRLLLRLRCSTKVGLLCLILVNGFEFSIVYIEYLLDCLLIVVCGLVNVICFKGAVVWLLVYLLVTLLVTIDGYFGGLVLIKV